MAKVQFTVVYDWLAHRRDLSWPEKILIAHVLRFGASGCFKSNNKLAHDLGLDRVTVIRLIKSLIGREWLAVLFENRRDRILYVAEEKLDDMPLLAGVKGCGKPVRKPVKSQNKASGAAPQVSGAAPQVSGAAPLAFNRTRRDLSYIDEKEKREVDFLASVMKERAGKPNAKEFERRRQQLIKQTKNLENS